MTSSSYLVSTDWLEANLDNRDVVVLDSTIFLESGSDLAGQAKFSSGIDAFERSGHIPGARFADLFTEFSNPLARFPFMRPTAAQFAAAAGRLGIVPETRVVIYDRLIGQWASRLWWVFRTFGHERVAVLDGGLRKYAAEGRTLRTGAPSSYAAAVYPVPDKVQKVASEADVVDIVEGRRPGRLVCLLQPAEYAGLVSARQRAGHIPGSVNVPFFALVDEETNTVRPADELRKVFAASLPLDGGTIVTYCGGGIASTLGALALAVIGYDNHLEYDGALLEWVSNPDRPLALGA